MNTMHLKNTCFSTPCEPLMSAHTTPMTLDDTARQIAALFTQPHRTASPKTPLDYGMAFEDLRFPTDDGLSLSAWFIPAQGSQKLAIMNHPLYCSKYGFVPEGDVAQLVPIHVEFLNTARHLHAAGFNVLTYDLRNHGNSDASADGRAGIGYHEWQDAVAAMRYVAQRADLAQQDIALVSHCMGANASMRAMSLHPALFERVKVMVAVQPIHMKYMAEKAIAMFGGGTTVEGVDRAIQALAGFSLNEMSPYAFLADLRVPVLYSQVRQDVLTSPQDLEYIVAHTPTETKMLWIEGPLNRFDGYNHFGQHPEEMLNWLQRHMS